MTARSRGPGVTIVTRLPSAPSALAWHSSARVISCRIRRSIRRCGWSG